MPVGGKRPGAGRPRGAKQKIPNVDRRKAAESGLMPLDVILTHMRALHARVDEVEDDERISARLAAVSVAKDAAPYLHAKLQATTISGPNGGPVEVNDTSSLELARRIAFLLTTAKPPQ